MSYNRERTNIKIRTNFAARNPKDRDVDFTLNMLKHPKLTITGDMEDKPFFTYDFYFPYDILVRLPYQEIVQFFFSREYGEQFYLRYAKSIVLAKYSEEKINENEEEEFYKERSQIIEENVKTMLKLLFQTSPTSENITTSLEYVKTGRDPMTFPSIKGLLALGQTDKVTLDIKGKICTFEKITWLNDVLNHPDYNDFLNDYIRFITWSNSEIRKSNKKLRDLKKDISKKCKRVLERALNYCCRKKALSKIEGSQVDFLIRFQTIIFIIDNNIDTIDDVDAFLQERETELQTKINEKTGVNTVFIQQTSGVMNTYNNIDIILSENKTNTNLVYFLLELFNEMDTSRYKALGPGTSALVVDKTLAADITSDAKAIRSLNASSDNRRETIEYLGKTETLLNSYRKVPLSEIRERRPEYSNYMAKVQKFNSVIKETSNHELQNLIDMTTTDDVEKFFSFMYYLHHHYILGEKQVLDKTKTDLDETRALKWMDTGITIDNARGNDSSAPKTINLFILCELRLVNQKENEKQKNCKEKDAYLGQLIGNITRSRQNNQIPYVNKNSWNVDFNRPRIEASNIGRSTSVNSSSNGFADRGFADRGFADRGFADRGFADRGFTNQKSQLRERDNRAAPNTSYVFSEFIRGLTEENKKKFSEYIKSINEKKNPTETEIDTNNLFELLSKDKMEEARLFVGLVSELSKGGDNQNIKLIQGFIALQGQLTTNINKNKYALSIIREADVSKTNEIAKLKYEIAKYNLLLFLIDNLMEEENKKPKMYAKGGKKTRNNRKKQKKCRTYKRII